MPAALTGGYFFSSQLLSLAAGLSSYKDNLSAKVRTVTGSDTPDGALKRAVNSIEVLGTVIKNEGGGARSGATMRRARSPAFDEPQAAGVQIPRDLREI